MQPNIGWGQGGWVQGGGGWGQGGWVQGGGASLLCKPIATASKNDGQQWKFSGTDP